MRRVREDMGLTNVKLMVPFCRTPEEGRRVIALMAQEGLRRGEHGLEVYVMCEVPSNVVRAREFADIFDGFSIGSNDLTQLVLGLDRDSELVAPLFDERNPAVLAMVGAVIDAARRAGRKIGICGQAPSDYPEFTRFLVRRGITSISFNPDALVQEIDLGTAPTWENLIYAAVIATIAYTGIEAASNLAPEVDAQPAALRRPRHHLAAVARAPSRLRRGAQPCAPT
jgi:pyruvate,water dikinase